MSSPHESSPGRVLESLLKAVNGHDLEGLTRCFADDYVNETPAHPSRGFRGRDQVHSNWTQIFGTVPDLGARVTGTALQGQTLWTEWEMSGTRADGSPFLMRGVVIFDITSTVISSARFYLEPVEDTSGGPDQAVSRAVGRTPAPSERNR
jgi:ketosteroid isomerase-like protein